MCSDCAPRYPSKPHIRRTNGCKYNYCVLACTQTLSHVALVTSIVLSHLVVPNSSTIRVVCGAAECVWLPRRMDVSYGWRRTHHHRSRQRANNDWNVPDCEMKFISDQFRIRTVWNRSSTNIPVNLLTFRIHFRHTKQPPTVTNTVRECSLCCGLSIDYFGTKVHADTSPCMCVSLWIATLYTSIPYGAEYFRGRECAAQYARAEPSTSFALSLSAVFGSGYTYTFIIQRVSSNAQLYIYTHEWRHTHREAHPWHSCAEYSNSRKLSEQQKSYNTHTERICSELCALQRTTCTVCQTIRAFPT